MTELLSFLSEKYTNITKSGFKDGLKLDDETERDLIHKLLLEGLPFYILDKIKVSIKQYEESISEQPMLLAHPSGIKNQEFIKFIDSNFIESLVKKDHFFIDKKVYYQLEDYKIYDEFKYLYSENNFEDISLKNPNRKDFIFKFNMNYFKNSKHRQIAEICSLLYYLPFELNSKLPILSLQTNEYLIASYFRENYGSIKMNLDSSFDHDSGKKISVVIPLFSRDLEVIDFNLILF